MSTTMSERDEVILILRRELKRRSGKTWSVRGGTGTAWGWITISAPPARRGSLGMMTEADQQELSALLGEQVHDQGVLIPASGAHRIEYVDRARGLAAKTTPAYWD